MSGHAHILNAGVSNGYLHTLDPFFNVDIHGSPGYKRNVYPNFTWACGENVHVNWEASSVDSSDRLAIQCSTGRAILVYN
ncbi:uncharacterized protein FOMMEDRAFT_19548, partial [Fomitiporia mediterranea MF3/22]|uniref:uncharacterized protein n=1 Tax=Fomitiporia mediterranea (strain MF3/22) TaxID=694068 RepID=UPI0004407878